MAKTANALPGAPPTGKRQDGHSQAAVIRQLTIDRYRGIHHLKWNPAAGLNMVLGGGDVGKTTILEAIALLLNPSNAAVLSESDYCDRKTAAEFVIQGVFSLPAASEIGQQQKFVWPWEWNGTDAIAPIIPDGASGDLPAVEQPVYRLQVRGTSDLELSWEIVQPNDEFDGLSSAVRRAIGIVRLGSDDRNDRDLRLVYGSALDRLLADQGLRARIGQQVSDINLNEKLSAEARTALSRLDQALRDGSLPHGVELGITSAQGVSIGALIGLLAQKKEDTSLPLASWGAGTRRMATLQVAAATQAKTRITVIDEVERGLEPYRVRRLIKSLQAETTQSFVTTHSPVAIGAATEGSLWYLDANGAIGELAREKVMYQQQRDPETFLSRLSVIAEGPTEVGFVSCLLEKALSGKPLDLGVRVCNGQGTPAVLELLEAMSSGGLTFGGFVDAAAKGPHRWKALKEKLGPLLFQWDVGCTEERIIALVDQDRLIELLKDSDGDIDPERRATLADRLNIADKSVEAIVAAAADLRALIIAAATGNSAGAPAAAVKTWKKHGRRWFKSEEGGRELAEKVFTLGVWPTLKATFLPFLNAVREVFRQSEIDDL